MSSDAESTDDPMKFWQETLGGARYVMAPMVDMSELAFRMLGRAHGVQLCYTPMLHAQRYTSEDHYRKHYFTTCPQDRPLIVQFCANDAETFVEACKLVQDRCDAVDLNLGCPQIIAKRGHYGSFLQDEWSVIAEIVARAARELHVPVTCKIRVHPDRDRTVEYARMIEKAGCKLLTVHGRTREQKGHQTGLADWDVIREIRSALSIPVFANGNVLSRDDADQCIQYTGVQGVMAAEGLLHCPGLFSERHPPVWEMAREFLHYCQTYPTDPGHVRTHLFRILAYSLELYPDLRTRLAESNNIPVYQQIITELENKLKTDFKHEMEAYDAQQSLEHCENCEKARDESRTADQNHENSNPVNTHSESDTGAMKRKSDVNDPESKRSRPDAAELASQSAKRWKDFPRWLCHARARVAKSATATVSSETRREIFGVHLTDGNPDHEGAREGTTRNKESKTERKLRQYERRVAGKKLKRQQKREDRRQRRQELIAQGVSLKKHADCDHVEKRDLVRGMRERMELAVREGQRVCIDMGLEHLMSQKECAKLAQQIRRLYGSNRKADKPFHMCMTSVNKDGVLYKECVRKNMGFENYMITMYESSHLSAFPPEAVTYLSPDAELELETLDRDRVYVIGGLVDETVKKGRTTEAAQKARIQHARLPLDKYMVKGERGNYSKILTVNQVFDILLTFHNTGSWREALRHVPPRTGYVGRTTEAAQKARIQHARLPLDKYMVKGERGNYSKILTVNQVFDILLTFHNTGSWREALRHVPPRTGYVVSEDS